MKIKSINILDCTLRDGGYYNNWDFSYTLINKYLDVMSTLKINYVELGFRSFDNFKYKGSCAYTSDEFIDQIDIFRNIKIGVMINASEVLNHELGIHKAISLLFKNSNKSRVSVVRIACHFQELNGAIKCGSILKKKGYKVGINLMQISERSDEEINKFLTLVSKNPPDVIYFADSMGSMDSKQIKKTIGLIKNKWHGAFGIHAHDNMGQALTNSLTALREGATWVDCTVTGMGRGAGNVKTELLISEIFDLNFLSQNLSQLLSLIKNYFEPMKQKYDWGPNTYYYLAGKYGIHPTFIQEMLSDTRYNPEDVISVIDYLNQKGGKKFNSQDLENARYFYSKKPVGTWAPKNLIRGRDVLILGSGPNLSNHINAVEKYIQKNKPFVIALNAQQTINEKFINIRAASHPIRILADLNTLKKLPQPLAIPISLLPETFKKKFSGKKLLDFGISIQSKKFIFKQYFATVPSSIVVSYALSIATSGKANKILIAGFDGYGLDDPRQNEMQSLLKDYFNTKNSIKIFSLTKSNYDIPSLSIYSIL